MTQDIDLSGQQQLSRRLVQAKAARAEPSSSIHPAPSQQLQRWLPHRPPPSRPILPRLALSSFFGSAPTLLRSPSETLSTSSCSSFPLVGPIVPPLSLSFCHLEGPAAHQLLSAFPFLVIELICRAANRLATSPGSRLLGSGRASISIWLSKVCECVSTDVWV